MKQDKDKEEGENKVNLESTAGTTALYNMFGPSIPRGRYFQKRWMNYITVNELIRFDLIEMLYKL